MVGATGGVMVLCVLAVVLGSSGGDCGGSGVSAPPSGTRTAPEVVHYLESQGLTPDAAGGVTGNLMQESGLDPEAPGGGLAQWIGDRWTALVAWTASQGLSASSMAGQLAYLAYDLHTAYSALLTRLNAASDPGVAAREFMVVYERCDPAQCELGNRMLYASLAVGQAGGANGATPVSFITGPACASAAPNGHGVINPIPGFTHGRDDMGVDGCATPGAPIVAPAASQLVEVVPGWYGPQPLLLFRFVSPLPGTLDGDQYWFIAEEIVPVTTTIGTTFGQGQPVAHYAPQGTCVEVGWGSPTSNSRTLASQLGDSAAANPPAGAATVWGETFRRYFGVS